MTIPHTIYITILKTKFSTTEYEKICILLSYGDHTLIGESLPWFFRVDTFESIVGAQWPYDIDREETQGKKSEGVALSSIVPERPEYLEALDGHVDLCAEGSTARYPLMAWRTWILVY